MLRWFDGFETLAANTAQIQRRYTVQGQVSISTTEQRTGARCLQWLHNNTYSVAMELDDQTTWITGFAMKVPADLTTSASGICHLLDSAGAEQLSLEVASGKLAVYRGSTELCIGTTPLIANVWYFIEWKSTIANSGGYTEVRLNNITECSFTGDTQNTAVASARTVRMNAQGEGGVGAANNSWRDDWYICDGTGTEHNDFLGDVKSVALRPTAEGTYSDFTPSAGTNNALNVDDATSDDDTTYNSSATAGHKDLYVMEDLPAGVAEVIGIRQTTVRRKDDAGGRTVRQLLKSGSTEDPGPTVAAFDSYTETSRVLPEDPDTDAAWTISAVNAIEAGIEVVT